MPLCDASVAFWLVPTLRFPGWQWVMIALAAPVVCWAAWPIYAAAARSARHRAMTMDTLVSIGILASVAWSVYAMFWRDTASGQRSILFVLAHGSGGSLYLDVAAGVTTFVLAGRYFEAISRRRAGSALRALAGVAAKDVAIVGDDGVEERRPTSFLAVGDRFVVRHGETVATDGVVVSGASAIDRSAMTGESLPVDVGPGDPVQGGTISLGGRLLVRATRVGQQTQLAQMVRLVERAQDEKAAAQRLADRISGVFVPVVLAGRGGHPGRLVAGRGELWPGLLCRPLRPHHRLSVRARAGHPGGTARRHRRGGADGHLLQGLRRSRILPTGRHRRPRQDGDADPGPHGGLRRRVRRRRRRGRAGGLGRRRRAGVGASHRAGHRSTRPSLWADLRRAGLVHGHSRDTA